MRCRIEIPHLALQLHIGCEETERSEAQPIHLRATVRSARVFEAARTDELRDTLDAAALHETLVEQADAVRVKTLERLAQHLEERLRERFPGHGDLEWELAIAKPSYGWTYVHAWTT